MRFSSSFNKRAFIVTRNSMRDSVATHRKRHIASNNTSSGEPKLMQAMLALATDDVLRGQGRNYEEAIMWFKGKLDSRISFEDCCLYLGIDSDFYLQKLRKRGVHV